MPNVQPPTADEGEGAPSPEEPEGDIRRGGWILVLVGAVLVLVALFLLFLF